MGSGFDDIIKRNREALGDDYSDGPPVVEDSRKPVLPKRGFQLPSQQKGARTSPLLVIGVVIAGFLLLYLYMRFGGSGDDY
jgi:hypothetical protein